MKKLIALALALCLSSAQAQMALTGAGGLSPVPSGGGGSPPSLDGTPVRHLVNGGGVTSSTASSVTIAVNDIVVALISSANEPTSCSGSQNGSFTKLGDINGTGTWSAIWYVVSSHSGTENVTCSQASGSYMDLIAFGVSGANTSVPWDPLSGATNYVANSTFHSVGPAITTVNGNTMPLGVGADGSCGGPFTADSGWTTLSAAMTCGLAEYRQSVGTGTFTFNSTDYFFGTGIAAALKH